MLDVDHLIGQVRFRVRNDLYQNYYTVTINSFHKPKDMAVRCQCPYNMGEICRHEVAALFQLNEIIQSGFFQNVQVVYDQKHTVVRMRQITRQMLMIFTSADALEYAERMAAANKAVFKKKGDDHVEADVVLEDGTFRVGIKLNEERYFDTSCTCSEDKYPICVHKAIVFLQVLRTWGATYFQSGRNIDLLKNKLLEQYGFTLSDDLTNKFAFVIEGGRPFLRVLDPNLKKVAKVGVTAVAAKPSVNVEPEAPENLGLGVVLVVNKKLFPFVDVVPVMGTVGDGGSFVSGFSVLDFQHPINVGAFAGDERDALQLLRKLSREELFRYLKKNLPFGDYVSDFESLIGEMPTAEVSERIWEYLLPKYKKLLDKYSRNHLTYLNTPGKPLTLSNLVKVDFSDQAAHVQLIVCKVGGMFKVTLEFIIEHTVVPFANAEVLAAGIVLSRNTVYVLGDMSEVALVEEFDGVGEKVVPEVEWDAFLEKKVMVWNERVHVHFSEELVEPIATATPECKIYIHEKEHMLVFKPIFVYRGIEVSPTQFGDVVSASAGLVRIVKRNDEAEEEFMTLMNGLHPDIQHNRKEKTFFLSESAVFANNWFAKFIEKVKSRNIELVGYDSLRTMKVNIHQPETRLHIGSGFDWFDASLEVSFGDQTVTLSEVKKALTSKQNFVKLADGSIGMLPEEWIAKYGLLLKIGEAKGNKLKLKKYHFSVLEELLVEADDGGVIDELRNKKERLEEVLSGNLPTAQPPEHLMAVLRPYQMAGFQWLKFLNEVGWGGILADDMGLGKTIQTLTFFQYYKNEHPGCKFLVVCPTTLMYNWEKEIAKFTPTLSSTIHHGPKRTGKLSAFDGIDIVITTYGTMRSDIKLFKEVDYDYVVLDESQSIKNPQSQVARASLLLQAKNRLALSGTPVQNNTFDLYAQMNFLNPGMLGSREFFMNEFANPIDKFKEDEIKAQLRKLTYPFLLRRSKEQVAKDLPEKTETILYCEMGADQRKIYDAYRNIYRSQILGMIEDKGMERSQMHILQGLTKLRQICDSPAILNETERYPNYSAKLDELSREINENVGDHKVLIFSQFLGMLALIRAKLEHDGIPHVYFDGSSTSAERERAITEFQNNHDCRVFLISLKAGGIGLNLTAADYVYIVDPWWNPAVEQQAIDRTHRIGQTKNIFAYRLICKDSLEEKMLQLQEQKRILANDLVGDDNAMMKRLSKEDVVFLFS